MIQRDEQLAALEAAVKSAESKLKSADMQADEIGKKLKSNEEAFMQLISERSERYEAQNGTKLVRDVDKATENVTYNFVREATEKEQKKRQKIVFQRVYDESGKYKLKPELVLDENDKTVTVMSAKDLKKPKERKRFIAVELPLLGIRRIDTNSPFVKTIGKPIVVPARAAVKLAEKISETKVGKTSAAAAKLISSPIVIPAKIIKDITDKGGVIHAVVDLGDKIRIEGNNTPKPLKAVVDTAKNVALGAETGVTESAKSIGNFSIEIAKSKITEEINKGVSENEATEAAYVIGMKMFDVYKILDEHSKFKKAVRRDIAGDDIVDTEVSKFLAEKDERKFQKTQDKLKEQKAAADNTAKSARAEYEAAKKRLEGYKKRVAGTEDKTEPKKSEDISKKDNGSKAEKKHNGENSPKNVNVTEAKSVSNGEKKAEVLTKTDKKIEQTKQKLKLNQKHKDKVTAQKTPTAWNTAKKLDGYFVGTGIQSMRRKAMRDGGDNSAVQATDFAVTALQKANRTIKVFDEKERAFKEKALKKKLTKLDNKKNLETAASKLREHSDTKAVSKEKPKKKTSQKQKSANQNKLRQKKRQQKLVRNNFVEKSKEAVKNKVKELAGAALKRSGSIVVIIILGLLVPVMFPVMSLSGSGVTGGIEGFIGSAVSPCDTNDLSLSEQYYTELAKNLIEQHRNIRDYYVGYDNYSCLTEIDKIDHSPQKLLPYLAVSAMSVSDSDSWDFETAQPFIESLFDSLYELYTNEIYEVRKHVTQTSDTQESDEFPLGGSTYTLSDGTTFDSADYAGYANTYTYVEVMVASGRESVTYSDVGKYTDSSGFTHEYDTAQDITYDNYWDLKLIYQWNGEEYTEHWRYYTECQEYYEYDYATLEYAIREKDISVYDSYWTDTDSDWQDNNFDKLIYNQYCDMSDEDKELFDTYYAFFMGHQIFDMPFENAEISKYAGYNTDINGDMSLDQSFELKTYDGQEIKCGMDGEITLIERGFYVYNEKYGTIYYDGAASPSVSSAKQGDVISSSTGDVLRITYIDNEGNYINPLFVFS